jgi:hypothetical protein
MVKRRSTPRQNRAPFILGMVAAGVLLLFVAGELFAWAASDSGRLAVWRWLHAGDRAPVCRVMPSPPGSSRATDPRSIGG